ncbi:MAG: AAA family ATPase [Solirubrobacteraceae bacterium]
MRETHISWVFLVGDRAYKLKKPLVLPFVDYGTATRRREMCLEEVRLNRRLAPSIYLGVRGITRTPDGLQLCAASDSRAVDYVVEMRRYDEDRTLAATLQRRELTNPEIADVARTLAGFHAGSPGVSGPDYGAHRVEREVDRNLEELLAVTERRSERARMRALARFMSAFVDSRWRELDERGSMACVRECHGDLRAEHVVLETPLSVVDCVEFDASLRTLDVADDLAFLVMDLAALDGEEFSGPLVEAYRAAGGTPGDDPLLAFYAVHRALVRAKVLLVRAAQHPPGSVPHQTSSSKARELLDLAERFSWQARLPLAIVFCGVPASGKSYLANEIAKRSRLPHLSSDLIRKQLAGRRPTQAAAPEHYSDEFSQTTYAQLGHRAASEVAQGGGVLVDATFRRRRDRVAFAHAFADAAPLLFVECLTPADVLIERGRARERDPDRVSDATLEIVMREHDSWEPLDELTSLHHVPLRTDRPVESITADLVALLDQRPCADPDREASVQ